ncbi:ferritin-like domain-containing protein [Mucilaginibacter mali]|uniref:Ferritin-like domain-containing protein n=1 Tax=Mucilaginibacter mali TaxID=2740462 RepID=A0A7D4UB35_9SPHI|nr:ferritin-like domain-containing protein [Mucilaginibacter mali]QKJ30458.1 ferritin-like domain-containing protein [Mucilaginibacter mali]
MNLFELFEDIEKADPEFQDRISPRRDAIKNMTSFGSKVAVAALPFAFSELLKKAYGQVPSSAVLATLNFALKLEYFEAAFYRTGLAQASLVVPTSDRTNILAPIAAHEVSHVNFLKTALGTNAVAQPADSSYDFTAGGAFATVFTNYATFLAVAQVLEDTGVRAYKGQAGVLLKDQTYLTAALNIHSVEARHASAIRYLRRTTISGASATKPWISLGTGNVANDTGISTVDGNYASENNTMQGSPAVDITKLPGVSANSTISLSAAVEAFDEPLTMAQVLNLVAPFHVS